jgi:hypothetical protein
LKKKRKKRQKNKNLTKDPNHPFIKDPSLPKSHPHLENLKPLLLLKWKIEVET